MLHQTKPSLISPPHRESGCDQSSLASVRDLQSPLLAGVNPRNLSQVTTRDSARWIASNPSLDGKTGAEARE